MNNEIISALILYGIIGPGITYNIHAEKYCLQNKTVTYNTNYYLTLWIGVLLPQHLSTTTSSYHHIAVDLMIFPTSLVNMSTGLWWGVDLEKNAEMMERQT